MTSLTPYTPLVWKNTDSPIDPATINDPYLDADTLNEREQLIKDIVDAIIAIQNIHQLNFIAGAGIDITNDGQGNITISISTPINQGFGVQAFGISSFGGSS